MIAKRALCFVLATAAFLSLTQCVTEMAKFPQTVKDQWGETSMIDTTLVSVSGTLQIVTAQPESSGYNRLRIYQKASAKVRRLVAAEGLPEFIRETNRPLLFPRLELFYLKKGKKVQFEGQKQFTSYYADGPTSQPLSQTAPADLDHMRELSDLQKNVR